MHDTQKKIENENLIDRNQLLFKSNHKDKYFTKSFDILYYFIAT